nr:MAG TPA: hypothetical protein [Ackermannviridae sp.]DAK97950.1 MAG TPA: hypothetical protein [Ackermannviridae sp.]DAM68011.1 MAG TPA: hypothetical protein [Ackermannviridae sp.]
MLFNSSFIIFFILVILTITIYYRINICSN